MIRKLLPVVLLLALSLVLMGAGPAKKRGGPGGKVKRVEQRSWKTVEQAVERGDPQAIQTRAEEYLRRFPKGKYILKAHRAAGSAALSMDAWPACRHHLDAYLNGGGRKDVQQVSFEATLCRAREGKDPEVVNALRNIAVNSDDKAQSAQAARELVAYHLRAEQWRPAFDAQALLLSRGVYVAARDIGDSRKAGEAFSETALSLMESEVVGTPLGGVFAFLRLEREDLMGEDEEGQEARSKFLSTYPEHPLIDLIPDAELLLTEVSSGQPTTVGVLLPLSGRFKEPGNNALRGVEMALADLRYSSDGPVDDLELIVFDTESTVEKAVEGARLLATEHGVVAILGPIVGDDAEAVGAVADELNVPFLMTSQRRNVTEGHPTVFNNWVGNDEQVDAIVEFVMSQLAVDSFAIAYPEREAAGRMVERFWTGIEELGGQVTTIEPYPNGTTDFTKIARRVTGKHYERKPATEVDLLLPYLLPERVKAHIVPPLERLKPGVDFHAVFVPDHFRAMAMLAPGFVSERINLSGYLSEHRGIPVPIIGGAALNHPDLMRIGKKFTEGVMLVDGFFTGSHDENVQRFVLQYKLLHGRLPAMLEAASYDSGHFLFELLDRGITSREELIATLELITPSSSVIGSTGFGGNREMQHDLIVLQVKDRQFVQIHPTPPENPIRYEVDENGLLLAYQEDVKGNRVEVALETEEFLRLPGQEDEEAKEDGDDDDSASSEPPETKDAGKAPEAPAPKKKEADADPEPAPAPEKKESPEP